STLKSPSYTKSVSWQHYRLAFMFAGLRGINLCLLVHLRDTGFYVAGCNSAHTWR
ncbi:transposase, partial [Shigella dysenteriae]